MPLDPLRFHLHFHELGPLLENPDLLIPVHVFALLLFYESPSPILGAWPQFFDFKESDAGLPRVLRSLEEEFPICNNAVGREIIGKIRRYLTWDPVEPVEEPAVCVFHLAEVRVELRFPHCVEVGFKKGFDERLH